MAISDNLRGVIYMNVSMMAFTVNDTFMKTVTQTLPLFEAIALRGVISTVALLIIAQAMGGLRLWPERRDRGVMAWRSLAEVGGTVFFLVALTHMPLANLSAIMQVLPLAVALAAAVFLGVPMGWRRVTAILVGFVGVIIIIRPGAASFDVWSVLGLASVVCVVARDLATRALSPGVPSTTVSVWAAVSVTGLGLVGASVQGWQSVDRAEALLILGAAAFLIVGYLFSVMVMRVGDIGVIAPFRYTALLWAILLGWLIFGTLPDNWTLIGAAIVVASGLFALWRERASRRAAVV
ncbi:MAG: DMT family transporter [Paracoccaceae bacterium]